MEDLEKDCDPFQIFGSNVHLREWGMAVSSEFRGYEVGHNIGVSVCRMATALRIPGMLVMPTRIETQIFAERFGFQTFNEIVYDDYRDDDGNVIFPITDAKSFKLMGRKY